MKPRLEWSSTVENQPGWKPFRRASRETSLTPRVSSHLDMTGLGHQAVMVFFVLSEFFIGGSVLSTLDHWSWRRYLVNRLTRLCLVLLPTLLLTAALDYCARRQAAGPTYFDHPIAHFNTYPLAGRNSLGVLVGNALFLQNILVPTFGSNSPLWSLANEFWYYMLFPLVALALFSRRTMLRRLSCGLASIALAAWLGAPFWVGFVIWLLGAAIHFTPTVNGRPTFCFAVKVGLACVFGFVLALSRIGRIPSAWCDIAVGFWFAVWLYGIVKFRATTLGEPDAYRRVARMLSSCSYSVYAIHFPIALLVRTSVGITLWTTTAANLGLWGAVAVAIFLVGLLLSTFTEAKTGIMRSRLLTITDLSF